MSSELLWMSASELAARIRARQVSPVEVVEAVLAQLDRVNPQLNAVVTRVDEAARGAAREAEAAVMRGDTLGPLHGVPITVKDLHLTAGIRTTFGSRLFADFVPATDTPAVAGLKAAGAIVLGKTNTSEFGLTPLTMNALFGDAYNPWDLSRNTGGSSGGSAAAVACGVGPLATGSDGGGSIRIPASFCGVYGIKPQLGRVPDLRHLRGWESLAHHGPITRTVRDAALALDVMAGQDLCDRWSLPKPSRSFLAACTGEARGLRLAWCPTLGGLPLDDEVRSACDAAARRFAQLGCEVVELELDLPDLGPAQQTIVLCETIVAFSERLAEWEQLIDPRLQKMPAKAARLTAEDLVRAQFAREDYWERLAPLFTRYDALLTPTASLTATENNSLGPTEIDGARVRALYWLGFCVPFNMTGQPAASLPVGFDRQSLPIGLQVVGRPHDEFTVLRLSSAFEEASPWHGRRPPLAE
ncbi:MAG: amidase [Pirellulales bacterium]|nr:amidase [Pirellulales bacterium]